MKKFVLILVFLWGTFYTYPINAQVGRAARYQPGDWVTYANFHFITSFEEGEDYLYIGTTHGVLRYSQLMQNWDIPYTLSNGLYDDYVLNMVWVSENQELWVITRGGIDIIFGVNDRWQHIGQTNNIFQEFTQTVQVGQSQQSVFINLGNNVIAVDKFTHRVFQPNSGELEAARWKNLEYQSGQIPLYSLKDPSWYINRLNNTLEDEDYRQFPFTVRFRDSNNQEYIGTWGAGFIKADATTQIGEVLRFGPISTATGAIYKDDENLWFGSASNYFSGPPELVGLPGISKWNLEANSWYHITPEEETNIRNVTVYTIESDAHGGWLGTNRGLLYYNQEKNLWKTINEQQLSTVQISDIVVDDSTVWVGARSGLYEIANSSGTIRKKVPLLNKEVYAVHDLTKYKNYLFIGSENGLIRYEPSQGEIIYYNENGKMVPEEDFDFLRVFAITSLDEKIYYANTYGLFELNTVTNQVEQVPKVGLYARSGIRVIKAGPERLWVGFDDGVGELFPDRKEWEFYTTADGLASNTVFDILVDSQYAWFATERGVTRFRKTKY